MKVKRKSCLATLGLFCHGSSDVMHYFYWTNMSTDIKSPDVAVVLGLVAGCMED